MRLCSKFISAEDPANIWKKLQQGATLTLSEARCLEQALNNSALPKHTAKTLGKDNIWGDDLDELRTLLKPLLTNLPQ